MRLSFLLMLLIAVLFGSGYWYEMFDRTCSVPIRYRIGEIDPRFGANREELIRIAASAETVWENPLQKELFTYDERADFHINLVFDERQENSNIEEELREDLEAKKGMSAEFAEKYDVLIAEFRKLRNTYESRVLEYETRLSTYNREVGEWNARGGAPEPVREDLNKEVEALRIEQSEIEALGEKLNALVRDLNALGARANTLIKDYNTVVNKYNERVSESGEFTQGDYTGDSISVYEFNSEEELTLVLAHEFGHALSIDHVENEQSIMYPRMGGQKLETGLTTEDVAAFEGMCKKEGIIPALMRVLQNI